MYLDSHICTLQFKIPFFEDGLRPTGGTLRQDNCQLIGLSLIVLARQAQNPLTMLGTPFSNRLTNNVNQLEVPGSSFNDTDDPNCGGIHPLHSDYHTQRRLFSFSRRPLIPLSGPTIARVRKREKESWQTPVMLQMRSVRETLASTLLAGFLQLGAEILGEFGRSWARQHAEKPLHLFLLPGSWGGTLLHSTSILESQQASWHWSLLKTRRTNLLPSIACYQ